MSTKPYIRSLSNRLSHRLTPRQISIIESVEDAREQASRKAEETPPSIKRHPSLRLDSLKLPEHKQHTLKGVREEAERRQSEIREKVGDFFFNTTRRKMHSGGYERKSKKSKSKRKRTKR
jgi:hypothetical protein